MDRDPGDFLSPAARPVSDMSDGEFDTWVASLPPCPGIPSSEADAAAAEARARADIAAGRTYPHEVVSEWLRTWGEPAGTSFHDWYARRNG